jgi:Fe-S-cluster containining protein
MEGEKEAGVRCVHLMDDYRCALFGDASRPKVCSDYEAEPDFCGSDREEALRILYSLSDK